MIISADEEEEKVGFIAEEVSKKQKDCEEDLVKAEPALLAAQEALNTLNKNNLTELKSFGSPPGMCSYDTNINKRQSKAKKYTFKVLLRMLLLQ